jgi:hypothetical protein
MTRARAGVTGGRRYQCLPAAARVLRSTTAVGVPHPESRGSRDFSALLSPDASLRRDSGSAYFTFSLVHESGPVSRIAWKAAWRVTTSGPKAFAPGGNLSKSTLLPLHSIRGVAPKSVPPLAKRRPASSAQKARDPCSGRQRLPKFQQQAANSHGFPARLPELACRRRVCPPPAQPHQNRRSVIQMGWF